MAGFNLSAAVLLCAALAPGAARQTVDGLYGNTYTITALGNGIHALTWNQNTKGDLVIHLPAERIAIGGDMAITPMQFAFFSSPRKWIDTLARLAAIDAMTIVPGHGPLQTDKRFIADLQAMLRSVVEQVDAGIKAGQDLEALKASVKVVPPAGSICGKASTAALDALFRIPAIESAFKEKG